MLSVNDSPRTRIVTLLAKPDRYIAAWPAELPAPTTKQSWSLVPSASVMAAP